MFILKENEIDLCDLVWNFVYLYFNFSFVEGLVWMVKMFGIDCLNGFVLLEGLMIYCEMGVLVFKDYGFDVCFD